MMQWISENSPIKVMHFQLKIRRIFFNPPINRKGQNFHSTPSVFFPSTSVRLRLRRELSRTFTPKAQGASLRSPDFSGAEPVEAYFCITFVHVSFN